VHRHQSKFERNQIRYCCRVGSDVGALKTQWGTWKLSEHQLELLERTSIVLTCGLAGFVGLSARSGGNWGRFRGSPFYEWRLGAVVLTELQSFEGLGFEFSFRLQLLFQGLGLFSMRVFLSLEVPAQGFHYDAKLFVSRL